MRIPFFILLLFVSGKLFGQRDKLIYAEGMGAGIIYSFNYDMRFWNATYGPGFRIGTGVAAGREAFSIFLPTHLNWVLGNRHALEIGAGLVSILGKKSSESNFYFYPSAALVYRYTGDKGLSFRVGLNPTLISKDSDYAFLSHHVFWFWPAISIGFAFD